MFSFTPYFALIPTSLYRKEDEDLWVNFLSEEIPHDQVLKATEFPRFDCILVESISEDNEQHILAHLLVEAEKSDCSIFLCHQNSHMAMVCVNEGKLLLANVFETKNEADCLYYVTSVIRQLQLPENMAIYPVDCSESLTKLLQNFYHIKI